MQFSRSAAVVDSDVKRRAELSRFLFENALHAEPYESAEEISRHWPRSDLILVHDDGDTIARIMETMVDERDWLPIVAYGLNPSPARVVDTITGGAVDYIQWPATFEYLRERLGELMRARSGYAETCFRTVACRNLVATLSRRESQVLFAMARGGSNKHIALELEISPRTVEIHRANMLHKLGVDRSSDAIAVAVYAQLPASGNSADQAEGGNVIESLDEPFERVLWRSRRKLQ